MQDAVDLFGDWQLDAMIPRKRKQSRGCTHSFGHHLHLRKDVGQCAPPAQFKSDVPIAAEFPGTSQDQVTEAGETTGGLEFSAQGDDQTGHFRKTTRDERSERVVAETKPLASPRRNGHHILCGSGKLHTQNIFVAVETEIRSREFLLKIRAERTIFGGQHDGRRFASRGLDRERRA